MVTIAIIGSGLSGTLAAINLLKQAKAPISILLFEKATDQLNLGVAYHADNMYLPLNVPVKKMSLFSNEPNQFYEWLQTNKHLYTDALTETEPGSFVSRGVYGKYMQETLNSLKRTTTHHILNPITSDVVALDTESDSVHITTADGNSYKADKVIMALGNFPPVDVLIKDATFYDTSFYIGLPWGEASIKKIDLKDDVLILGNGLSMVDMLLSLKRAGHTGKIYTLSRNGLVPLPHAPATEIPLQLPTDNATALSLLSALRHQVKAAAEQGHDWRTVLDSIRAQTPAIWQSLSSPEKNRFVKRLRAYWDIHRHRIPPISHELIEQLKAEHRLTIIAAQIKAFAVRDNRVEATFKPKASANIESIVVDKVINCTGPHPDYSRVPSALVKHLLTSGQAQLDDLKMALAIDTNGAIIDAAGKPSKQLYTIGPMRRGLWWESVALREIRQQAEELPNIVLGVE